MTKKTILVVLIITSLFGFSACTEDAQVPKVDYSNAFPLQVGSYWVYQTTITFPNGASQVLGMLDSVWIEKDTVFNGKLFFIQKRTTMEPVNTYLRDSAGSVIANFLDHDDIIFSSNLLDTLFKNPPYYRIMMDVDKEVDVPVGRFKTVNCKLLLRMNPNDHSHNHDYPLQDQNFMIHEQRLYANKVGLVKRITYYIGNTIEEKLVRYKVK